MFNPFSTFEPRFLIAFKQKGVNAFVMQTYDRGRNMLEENPGPAFLLIHFNEVKRAREHFDAIKTDVNRQVFYLDDEADSKMLNTMIHHPGDRKFYTVLTIKDVNVKAKKLLDKNIHYYINYKTDWHPRGYEQVSFSLEIIFGEIHVRLQYGARSEKITLDELEKLGYVL